MNTASTCAHVCVSEAAWSLGSLSSSLSSLCRPAPLLPYLLLHSPAPWSNPHGGLDPLSQHAFWAFLSHCLRLCVLSSHFQNQEYCPCLGQVSTYGRGRSTNTHKSAQQSCRHFSRKECIQVGTLNTGTPEPCS